MCRTHGEGPTELRQMPDLKRRRDTLAPGIIVVLWLAGAILLGVVSQHVAGELIFAPRFASPDATEVVHAYFTARQWGYRALSERALASETQERLHAPNVVHPLIDDPFLARDLTVSALQATPLYGEYQGVAHCWRQGLKGNSDLPDRRGKDHLGVRDFQIAYQAQHMFGGCLEDLSQGLTRPQPRSLAAHDQGDRALINAGAPGRLSPREAAHLAFLIQPLTDWRGWLLHGIFSSMAVGDLLVDRQLRSPFGHGLTYPNAAPRMTHTPDVTHRELGKARAVGAGHQGLGAGSSASASARICSSSLSSSARTAARRPSPAREAPGFAHADAGGRSPCRSVRRLNSLRR